MMQERLTAVLTGLVVREEKEGLILLEKASRCEEKKREGRIREASTLLCSKKSSFAKKGLINERREGKE